MATTEELKAAMDDIASKMEGADPVRKARAGLVLNKLSAAYTKQRTNELTAEAEGPSSQTTDAEAAGVLAAGQFPGINVGAQFYPSGEDIQMVYGTGNPEIIADLERRQKEAPALASGFREQIAKTESEHPVIGALANVGGYLGRSAIMGPILAGAEQGAEITAARGGSAGQAVRAGFLGGAMGKAGETIFKIANPIVRAALGGTAPAVMERVASAVQRGEFNLVGDNEETVEVLGMKIPKTTLVAAGLSAALGTGGLIRGTGRAFSEPTMAAIEKMPGSAPAPGIGPVAPWKFGPFRGEGWKNVPAEMSAKDPVQLAAKNIAGGKPGRRGLTDKANARAAQEREAYQAELAATDNNVLAPETVDRAVGALETELERIGPTVTLRTPRLGGSRSVAAMQREPQSEFAPLRQEATSDYRAPEGLPEKVPGPVDMGGFRSERAIYPGSVERANVIQGHLDTLQKLQDAGKPITVKNFRLAKEALYNAEQPQLAKILDSAMEGDPSMEAFVKAQHERAARINKLEEGMQTLLRRPSSGSESEQILSAADEAAVGSEAKAILAEKPGPAREVPSNLRAKAENVLALHAKDPEGYNQNTADAVHDLFADLDPSAENFLRGIKALRDAQAHIPEALLRSGNTGWIIKLSSYLTPEVVGPRFSALGRYMQAATEPAAKASGFAGLRAGQAREKQAERDKAASLIGRQLP